MAHRTYEESKSVALKLIILLAIITVVEVLVALVGKGHIGDFIAPVWAMAIIMIGLSLYKAYKIVYEFMHLGHEVPAMLKSVLLPVLLLVWAIIAFFWEGNDWGQRRNYIKTQDNIKIESVTPQGMDIKALEEIKLN